MSDWVFPDGISGDAVLTREGALEVLRGVNLALPRSPGDRDPDFFTRIIPPTDHNGVLTMPWVMPMPAADLMLEAFAALGYEHPPFDYRAWEASERPDAPGWIGRASREDLARLLLAIRRHDRFCEGFLRERIGDGTFAAMVARVLEIEGVGAICRADAYLIEMKAALAELHKAYPHLESQPIPAPAAAELWRDGTRIWRGPGFPEPWGSHPRDRWVRVMADIAADGVWDVAGCGRSCDELPISPALVARIRAWQEWYDAEDTAMHFQPPPFYWWEVPGAPVGAFDAEGLAIARALKAELPPDWTVVHGEERFGPARRS